MDSPKYTRVYVGPITAAAFDTLARLSPNAEGKLIWAGTETVYFHPAIESIEINLGGSQPFKLDLRRGR